MLGRRSFIIAGGAAAAELGMGNSVFRAVAAEPVRYPDASIKVLDPRFQPLVVSIAAVERIATGCRFNEGPV